MSALTEKLERGSPNQMLKILIISTTCVWFGVCLAVYLWQEKMIFQPTQVLGSTPKRLGLAYEDVTLSTKDGETIHGWYVAHQEATSTVLFFHGNGGNIADRPLTLTHLHDLGLNVFMIDYRGYGRSSGTPSGEGTIIDAQAAWAYLVDRREIKPEEITIYGRSLGGAIAIALAATINPRAVIVESTFTSIADLGAITYPYLPISLLVRYDYKSIATITQLATPILIAHSPSDELISFTHAQSLFDAANAQKRFYRLRGSHNESFVRAGPDYYAALGQFINDPSDTSPAIDGP